MKILYFCDIDLNEKSAQPIHVLEIIKGLRSLGNNVYLYAPTNKKVSSKKIMYLRYFGKKFLRSISYNLSLLIFGGIFIMKNKPQLIYSRQGITLIAPAILGKLFSIPHIIEVNGKMGEQVKYLDRPTPSSIIRIADYIERFGYKNCEAIITSSNHLRDHVVRGYGQSSKKVHYLENGVDLDSFRPLNKNKCRKRINVETDHFYAGYIGGLSYWQGIEHMILSTSEVVKKVPNYKLIIIGDGPEKDSLSKLIKKMNLQNNVILKKGVSHKFVPEFINSFDISLCYLIKSKEGDYGTPFKVYEYLACGVPTIQSKINGISNLFGNSVMLANPDDPIDLAKKIIKLIKSRNLRDSYSKKGIKYIKNGHSWLDTSKKTEKIISKLFPNEL